MPTRPNYRNPPIVEAIIELVFDGEWSEAAHRDVLEKIEATYDGKSRSAERGDHEGGMTRAVLLETRDGREVIGLGLETMLMTLHALQPYPGWARLVTRVDDAMAYYVSAFKPRGLTRVGVRYLDRFIIPCPEEGVNLQQYLTCVPAAPPGSAQMNAFHFVIQGADPDGSITLMTVSSDDQDAHERGRSLPVIYDLNVERTFHEPIALSSWKSVASELHERQHLIFEESITDRMRGLFQ